MRNPIAYHVARNLFPGPAIRLAFGPQVIDRELLPRDGPAIIAANHLSFWDPVLIQLATRQRIVFAAKREYFSGPSAIGVFLRAAGMVPIDRRGGSDAEHALDILLAVLRRGGLVGIFPEGTRSRDGKLHRGRTGVGRLHLRSGAPIVPIAVLNTDEIQAAVRRYPAIKRATLRCGPSMTFGHVLDAAPEPVAARIVTDEVMCALQRLSGRPYVDEYGTWLRLGDDQ
ncbi:1-acyl-sn-glycerol-3-phosphate acyltransferase [Nonomuraea sp. SMC257]|uniref:1-acyl-sn-glycerol-3-phosphate acyltransferase n=1 Tax=Nonomuraea montanisoli TaxID=2741721 RepID=A0A7Y6ICA8_9ACTN|nr:lysophospholipid acyltransferase family protein [Nonomuraea montanisoli]NUW35565.1 1-acyl-sn-glycerol-3-phosphate acyltransferase [Nonomuraea montanisoli]